MKPLLEVPKRLFSATPRKEEVRDRRDGFVGRSLSTLVQDVRYGMRKLAGKPGLTAVAVATLALGIGANAAVFSLISALVFRPLRVSDPDGLVSVHRGGEGFLAEYLDYPMYASLRDRAKSFSGVTAAHIWRRMDFEPIASVTGGASSAVLNGSAKVQLVSGNFFDVFRASFVVGRGFLPEEDTVPGRNPVAVVSRLFWENRLLADPGVLGREVLIGRHRFTIVGVAREVPPASFNSDGETEIWTPLMMHREILGLPDRLGQALPWLHVHARIRPEISAAAARDEASTIVGSLDTGSQWSSLPMQLKPPTLEARGYLASEEVVAFFALPFLLLVIACANVGNIVLARGVTRGQELAIRQSLGAGRSRLVRQLLTESALLGLFGGAAGLLTASWLARSFVALFLGEWAMEVIDPGLDWRVIVFAFGVSLLTPLLFGLAPAFRTSRLGLAASLKASTGIGTARSRLAGIFVGVQMALSVLLMITAMTSGRFLERARQLTGNDLGRIVSIGPDLTTHGFPAERVARLYDELRARLTGVPGVGPVGFAINDPWGSGRLGITYTRGTGDLTERRTTARYGMVTPETIEALGMRVVAGRMFQPGDRGRHVVVATDTAARRLWPGENPVGKRYSNLRGVEYEVIGVVASTLGSEAFPEQAEVFGEIEAGIDTPFKLLVARVVGDPATTIAAMLHEARAIDPEIRPWAETAADATADWGSVLRKISLATAIVAVVAVFLAAIGLFGVVSFAVSQRTPEIGLRMALGASRRDVVALVLRRGLTSAAAGALVGIAIAIVIFVVWRTQVPGVQVADPSVLGAVVVVLGLVATVACWLPARRAARVDPMTALRAE